MGAKFIHMVSDIRDRFSREFSARELGLVVGVAINFGAVVWFAATVNASVLALQKAVNDLGAKVATIESEAASRAVLEYRLSQLERRVEVRAP